MDALLAATVDLGERGKDNIYGAGKLVLPLLQNPTGPRISSVSPQSVKYGETLTIRGQEFGTSRGNGRVVFYGGVYAASSEYVSWSDSEIRVRIPTGARKGEVLLITNMGKRTTTNLTVTSPWIGSVAPNPVRKAQEMITVTGENFGTTRGSSSVSIGSVVVPARWIATWSNAEIQYNLPVNTPTGYVTVTTAQGHSNPVNLAICSPYLTSLTPTTATRGTVVTLVGGNFGVTRGSGTVMFGGVRAATADYVSWGSNQINVKVPAGAQTAEVKVVTSNGESGSIRLQVEEDVVYRLPYPGTLGYSPPTVTGNPKGVKFAFQSIGTELQLTFEIKTVSAGDVRFYLNGQDYGAPQGDSGDWGRWSWRLDRSDQRTGRNTVEFRHIVNSTKSSDYETWQIRDIALWKPFDAKRIATLGGQQLPLSSGLGNPYPSPFNSEVTVPYSLAQEVPVRVAVYDLVGQKIKTLFEGVRPAGTHLLVWDGRNEGGSSVASGVYLIVADTLQLRERKRVVLLR